jgi:hypothetical protein
MLFLARLVNKPQFWLYGVGPGVLVYGALLGLTGNLRIEHILLLGVWAAMAFWPRTRPILSGLFPFFLFGLVYDALRFVTPALHRLIPPHVDEPYKLERYLFGVTGPDGRVLTPPEALQFVDSSVLLLLCAFAYFFYVYEVFLFGIYLLWRRDPMLRRFGWAFFILCFMGFVTWYVYPAAPPWYVVKYGLGAIADPTLPGDPARLAQADALLGIQFFHGFYVRSSNVFGAVPSLHAAYPLLVWLYVRHTPLKRYLAGFVAFWLLMGFSAVFLGHHYVIDVLLGAVYAVLAYHISEELLHRRWPEDETGGAPAGAVIEGGA